MASVKRRRLADGRTVRYDVIYRDPEGRQRNKTFLRRSDADAFANTVEADKLRGSFIDPNAGKVTVKAYAEAWLRAQTFDVSTRHAVEGRFRRHLYPVLGAKQLRHVKPSTAQAWLRGLVLAESSKRVIFANVSTLFQAAVNDELIAKNPFRSASVRTPRPTPRKLVPWSVERVQAVHEALPERYRIASVIASGLGLRQGEVFGLSPDDIDFLGKEVHVVRQLKLIGARPVFAPPKGGKTRTVPLPDTVSVELAAHLQRFPAAAVALPWRELEGESVTVSLIITTAQRTVVNRRYFNERFWKPALVRVGVIPPLKRGERNDRSREHGIHALRHWYASVLLDAGESIKAVSEYLGHADAGFTLRTYTHLMPASHERTRKAVDAAFLGSTGGTISEISVRSERR